MLQTRSSILLVAQVNTVAGGSIVQISNSSNLFITNTNLTVIVQNSGGLFAQQSGTWIVGVSNTATLTNPMPVQPPAIGYLAVGLGSTSIVNSAGWIISVAN